MKFDINEAINYFKNLEKQLITQIQEKPINTDNKNKIKERESGISKSYYSRTISTTKMCTIHRTHSHNAFECYVNNKNQRKSHNLTSRSTLEQNNLLFKEKIDNLKTVEFTGKVNDQNCDFLVDSGSSKNFINKE